MTNYIETLSDAAAAVAADVVTVPVVVPFVAVVTGAACPAPEKYRKVKSRSHRFFLKNLTQCFTT